MEIDKDKCSGCGICADACPRNAISLHDNLAVIDASLCTGCGNCVSVCPTGAIRQLAAAYTEPVKGSGRMYGHGRGFGFRGRSPSRPYIGRGRGGMPRCWYPGLRGGAAFYAAAGVTPYWPGSTRDEELGFLKSQALAMKEQLEQIENRIQKLGNET